MWTSVTPLDCNFFVINKKLKKMCLFINIGIFMHMEIQMLLSISSPT